MSVEEELEAVNLNLFIGNNAEWEFTVVDEDGSNPNITAASLTFTVKDAVEGSVVFQRKNTAAGGDDTEIEITNGAGGIFVVKIIPANTSSLDINTTYYYDAEINISNYGVKTIAHGTFTVNGK